VAVIKPLSPSASFVSAFLDETVLGNPDLNCMMRASQIIAVHEDPRLQFACQLYAKCLERHGEEHEETRLVQELIARLEACSPRGAAVGVQQPIPVHHDRSTVGG
jgi:hypothetical protein